MTEIICSIFYFICLLSVTLFIGNKQILKNKKILETKEKELQKLKNIFNNLN